MVSIQLHLKFILKLILILITTCRLRATELDQQQLDEKLANIAKEFGIDLDQYPENPPSEKNHLDVHGPISEISQEKQKPVNVNHERYSSFQCIGGSQVLQTTSMHQASVTDFPLNNPAYRTCLYRNVCIVDGSLVYYDRNSNVPEDYLPKGFGGNIHHIGYLRAFTLPMKTVKGSIPGDFKFSDMNITFLDANSWSFNYGHYLLDNVIPTFAASKIFNLPYLGVQQLFETNCRLFSTLEPSFSDRIVTYNHSMGSYREACLAKLDTMWAHFFDRPPLYIDNLKSTSLCFKKLIGGQGSTFGLKSIDLSRAVIFREFRDYVLKRIKKKFPPQEDLILVGLRTVGSAGGKIIHELCDNSKRALNSIPDFSTRFKVECFVPSDLSFEDEILQIQRAKVVLSVHGTISYMSLFSREGTQQISVASPKELKENQMLLYATHFHTYYLTWDNMEKLPGLLHHALLNSDSFYNDS